MELNNREIAILFWVVIALLYALRKGINKEISTSLIAVLKSFSHIKIQSAIGGGIIWTFICVLLLEEVGIWTLSNLKTTVIWCCTFALFSTMNAHKIGETKSYFKGELRSIVNTTAIITFITEAYSFSILTEIIITPIIILLVIIQALSERNPKLASIQKLSTFMLAIAGLTYIANAFHMLTQDFFGFASLESLREFLTPALLTCLYLLYIYIINIYITYDSLLISLTHVIKDPKLRRYATFKAAMAFKMNLKALHLWKTNVGIFRPGNKDEIIFSIREIQSQIYREKHPVSITPDQGWQPIKASSFLTDKNLTVDHYYRAHEDEWWGIAHISNIESSRLDRDSIMYAISGNDIAVKRLKLEVTINNKDCNSIPENLFIAIGSELIEHSTGSSEIDLWQAVNTDSDIDVVINGRRFRLSRENYKYTKSGGYLRTLIVDYHPLYRTPEDEE